uniref:Uncharacterized protein n=1 Tax=Setaria viridis TaxID=4556 RepID=A0A4U6VNK6_SETVI|nr:hypothetical protein SEVIR_2G097650v2 [Setaria viridis]
MKLCNWLFFFFFCTGDDLLNGMPRDMAPLKQW